VEDNGALYTSAPTLDLSDLGGSGAVFEIRFECEQLIYIKNNGTGYNSIPNFSVTLKWYENEKLVERSGFDMSLENITRLVDGSIYPDASGYGYSEDTILSYNANEITELSTSSSIGQQAIMKINSNDVSANDSTITDWYFEQNGIGYDPANPPAVSLTSLADYGSGAKFVVEVDNNGTFEENDMVMKDGGEGYVRNVNDFQGKGYTGTYGGDDYSLPNGSYIHNVKPGDVLRRSIYYGTGIRQSEE
jgi:hypothetical protein